MKNRSARTPLFAALKRVLHQAQAANAHQLPTDEWLDLQAHQKSFSRRGFLSLAAGGTTLLALAGCQQEAKPAETPKPQTLTPTQEKTQIAIVGSGIAGLNAAYTLQKAGFKAPIFDGNSRVGGRMYTGQNVCADGLYAELGGEFIDTDHEEMHALCEEFGLTLSDRESKEEAKLEAAYFFDGQHHTERQVIEAFRPVAKRMALDIDKLSDTITYTAHSPDDTRLDQMSLSQYLDSIGCSGWVRKLLEVAYITEYGLEANDLSAIAMLYLISTDTAKGFKIFGDSDERFKVKGGNEQVIHKLREKLQDQIQLGHTLEAIRTSAGGKYILSFTSGSNAKEVEADFVIMAIPFTKLRTVDTSKLNLPTWKTKAIQEVGDGMCTKLFAGVNERIWRKSKYSGELFSDTGIQLAWDNSLFQPGTAGGITFYSGGKAALDVGNGTPLEQVQKHLPLLDKAFPGVQALFNGKAERFHWPTNQWVKMAYSAYRVGQLTSIAGAEFEPVGNLHFAGEHTSLDYQGYMEGGAETGKRAAQAILEQVKGKTQSK